MKSIINELKELYLTAMEAETIRKLIRVYKIPKYSLGYALCYYQDIGIQSFKMFCLCLLIAHKVNEDYKIRSSSWSKYTHIDKRWLIENEIRVLQYFKHQMYLPNERVISASLNCISAFYSDKIIGSF